MKKLFPLLQLWALCSVMVALPFWLINGLLFPPLSLAWLLAVCAAVGVVITALLWWFVIGREP